MNFTGTFFSDVIHLLYPKVCAGCGSDLLHEQALICAGCLAELPVTEFESTPNNPVYRIFDGRLPIHFASSHVYFTKQSLVQQMLHRLKYQADKEIGFLMGTLMAEKLKDCGELSDLDMIVPLPLYVLKERKRGYNQAELISKGISAGLNVPMFNDIVTRKKSTETQTHKSRMERWQNIESKFEVRNYDRLRNKHVLLVDDVITTGATIESCGTELLRSGDSRLSIATFAYTSL